jgi:hypothetical protein
MNGFLVFLKALDPKVWLVLAIVAAFSTYTVAVYHAGGVGPRAEMAKLVASYQAAQKAQTEKDATRNAATKQLITKTEADRDANAKAAADNWTAYSKLLRERSASRPGKGTEPVRVAAQVCDNADQNDRLSDAIQSYKSEVRSSLDELWTATTERRQETGQLLVTATAQAIDYGSCQAWAVGEKAINASH